MEWKAAEVIELINLYRQCECLWNYKSSTYKRVDLKKNAWLHIANQCGKEVDTVKKKIKHLRNAYVLEKKKVDSCKKSGSSSELIYLPHLFYYTEMNFLDSVVVLRKTTSSLEVENVELGLEAEEITENETLTEDLSLSQSSSDVWSIPPPTPSPQMTRTSLKCRSKVSPSPSTSSSSSYGRRDRVSNRYSKFDQAIDAIVASTVADDNGNVFKSFANTISLQLQQLSLLEATETMSEIHQLVTKKVLASMANENSKSDDILQTALSEADILFE